MEESVSHKEFKKEVNEIASLIATSDGIHYFLGGEIKSLFAGDKEFRNFTKRLVKKLEKKGLVTDTGEPELIKVNKYLLERRTNIKPLLDKVKSDKDAEHLVTNKKEQSILSTHSEKILEALDFRNAYLKEAEERIDFLLKKSGRNFTDEKEKKKQIERIKAEISEGMKKEHTVEAGRRYLSNNFPQPKKTERILEAMKKTLDYNVRPHELEKLKEHFPRVERLKPPTHNKETRKARR